MCCLKFPKMKTKVLIFMTILFLPVIINVACESEHTALDYNSYYWLENKKIPVQKMTEKFYVVFYSDNEEKLMTELDAAGAVVTNVQERENYLPSVVDMSESVSKLFSNYKTATVEGDYGKIKNTLSSTLYYAPYYRSVEDGREIRLEFLFYVKLKPTTNLEQLEQLAKENTVEILGTGTSLEGWYYFACTNLSKGNALEMANLFYESGLFEYSSPTWGNNGSLHNKNSASLYY